MSLLEEIRKKWFFYLISIPGILCLILFSYLPMAGLYVVFERYTYQGGLFGSEFVGLQNFKFFFLNLDNALRATRNTLVINGFSIGVGVIVNVGLAIMLNEINLSKYRKVTQSVMLFPYFISWIVVGMVALALFDEKAGMVNSVITALGGTPLEWYSNPDYWWPIMIITTIWKNAGYGSIIYFCALTGFDQSLYEAAEIDGAGRWQRIWQITLPLLKPTIVIMFLLNIGGILAGGVDQIMGMTSLNPFLLETTDTIATFVYRSAIVNGQFESASAITLYQSIFGFVLVLGSNLLAKKIDPDYSLF
ncbi:MAG: sugar ABC transporter permease [Lachnospiraceae bacterium]|nr:sugar ABC transporter permease [Lachnospiraceae bacterium]